MLEGVLVPVGVVYVVFLFSYKIIKVLAQRRERRILAERVAENPGLAIPTLDWEVSKRANPYGWIKPAGLIIGLGVAFLVCSFVAPSGELDTREGFMVFAALLVFGGLGMLGGFFLERGLRKTDGD